jgi:deoxyribose-phosphate aldolase
VTAAEILGIIDHSILRADATAEDIVTACELAVRHEIAAVCVNPCWVELAAQHLYGSGVAVGATVGFPLGATTTRVKGGEAYNAVVDGATEVDMVINIGALKSDDLELVHEDIGFVVSSARDAGEVNGTGPIIVKAILEMCYFDQEEKIEAIMVAADAGVDFVKTSTGLGPGGATVADVALMRQLAPPQVGVKAAGGLRTLADLEAMIQAGANRLGTSHTWAIAEELERRA